MLIIRGNAAAIGEMGDSVFIVARAWTAEFHLRSFGAVCRTTAAI